MQRSQNPLTLFLPLRSIIAEISKSPHTFSATQVDDYGESEEEDESMIIVPKGKRGGGGGGGLDEAAAGKENVYVNCI